MPPLREKLASLLREGRFEDLTRLARTGRGALRTLTGLLYHDEALVRWRAVDMFGHLAVAMPDAVRPIVKRLLWFMNEESSTVGWGSAQAIGEIYRRNPEAAQYAIRVVVHFMDDEEVSNPANRNTAILAGSIWAIGNIAQTEPALSREMGPALLRFIHDPDPEIRALSAWALGRMGFSGAREGLAGLLGDTEKVELYIDGSLRQLEVKDAAMESLANIKRSITP